MKEFEISSKFRYSSLAQSVERVTVNHDVVGSSPTRGAIETLENTMFLRVSSFFLTTPIVFNFGVKTCISIQLK